MRRIVLTGGPGAGKTTIAQAMLHEAAGQIILIPEAATIVYGQLRTRWNLLDLAGRRDVQRRIYRLQVEQYESAIREHSGRLLLFDRGTVDGAAYWPDGPEDYWRAIGVSREAEMARYSAVIWLETSAAIGAYDGEGSNPCRHENTSAAIECGQRLAMVWEEHPSFHRVSASRTIQDKIERVKAIIESLA